MMIAKKLIKRRVIGNRIITEHHYRIVEGIDFYEMLTEFNDMVSDDWETQMDSGGIYCTRDGEFDSFDADMMLDWLYETIDNRKADGDDEEEYSWLNKWEKPLKEYKGYRIDVDARLPEEIGGKRI